MSVEGTPPRDQVVTFTRHFASYNAGESASFTADEAARLAELGVTEGDPPPTDPPVNTAVPHVSQDGELLNCTMGEWEGTPTAYAYQWQLDGATVGTGGATYTVLPADVGLTATCIVTATNALGSTEAPPSVGVVVT
jgi:hypothetical protein